MSLTMYRISVPVFIRGLRVLSQLLEKASLHAQASGIDPAELVDARLAPDMFGLAGQVQRTSDTAKLAIERLTGVQSPRMEDRESTFAELQERISKTIEYLESVDASKLDGTETRTVTLAFGEFKQSFSGEAYLLTFTLPNFFFHVTTAYDILRNKGVQVGKLDYLGPY
jgi:hypothetical protein